MVSNTLRYWRVFSSSLKIEKVKHFFFLPLKGTKVKPNTSRNTNHMHNGCATKIADLSSMKRVILDYSSRKSPE